MPLLLEIVTPEACVYSDTVESVVIPSVEGELGILPGHIPLLTQVDNGDLRVEKEGREFHLAVMGGFAEITGDRVAILAEHAVREEFIDEAVVQKAIARAEEALKESQSLDKTEVERLEGVLRFAVAQLSLKHRKR